MLRPTLAHRTPLTLAEACRPSRFYPIPFFTAFLLSLCGGLFAEDYGCGHTTPFNPYTRKYKTKKKSECVFIVTKNHIEIPAFVESAIHYTWGLKNASVSAAAYLRTHIPVYACTANPKTVIVTDSTPRGHSVDTLDYWLLEPTPRAWYYIKTHWSALAGAVVQPPIVWGPFGTLGAAERHLNRYYRSAGARTVIDATDYADDEYDAAYADTLARARHPRDPVDPRELQAFEHAVRVSEGRADRIRRAAFIALWQEHITTGQLKPVMTTRDFVEASKWHPSIRAMLEPVAGDGIDPGRLGGWLHRNAYSPTDGFMFAVAGRDTNRKTYRWTVEAAPEV